MESAGNQDVSLNGKGILLGITGGIAA